MPPTLSLPDWLRSAMVAHAMEGRPEEVCGFVAADMAGVPAAVFPIPNVAGQPRYRFRMEPAAQLEALSEIERRGWIVQGIYHSHPHGAAWPSETDRHGAFDPLWNDLCYPGVVSFILSLSDPTAPILRAYRFPDRETVEEVALVLH